MIKHDHLTPEQAKAFRIADNRLNEKGGWDEALLVAELNTLIENDIDVELSGFDKADLDLLTYNWKENPIDPEEEWEGMPNYQEDDSTKSLRKIIVHFYSEQAVTEFAEKLEVKVTDKTDAMRYPPEERRPGGVYVTAAEDEQEGDEPET